MRASFSSICVLLLAVIAVSGARADVPPIVNFQGRLLQSDGAPEAGILAVGFALYDVETGGSPIWSETQTVAFSEGFYSVMLGAISPLPLSVLNDPLYVSVTIAGTELVPRMQVSSVAFALRAGVAETLVATAVGPGSGLEADLLDGLDSADFASASHTHPAGDADTLDGLDSAAFAPSSHTHAPGDADTLDGLDSTGFAPALHDHDADYVNTGEAGSITTGMLTDAVAESRHVAPIVLSATSSPQYWDFTCGSVVAIPATTINFTVSVPSVLDLSWAALVANPSLGGATYTRIRVDGVEVGAAWGGLRNSGAGALGFGQAANVATASIGVGAHNVDVRATCDGAVGTGQIAQGTLKVVVWAE